jgi:uncharacterized protein YecT (DUF1311 family)
MSSPKNAQNIITVALAAVICVSFSVEAVAHDDDTLYSPAYGACIKASGGVTFDMADCIRGELVVQDRKLNEAYRALQKTLKKERRDQLTKAQRAWIAFRDANCDFQFDPEGGSMARLNAEYCMLSTTAHRAKELEAL